MDIDLALCRLDSQMQKCVTPFSVKDDILLDNMNNDYFPHHPQRLSRKLLSMISSITNFAKVWGK